MDYEGEFDWAGDLRRGEFPNHALVETDQHMVDRIQTIDSQAELIYNPRRDPGTWSLYRCIFRGASHNGDMLRHEFDLPNGATGDWVVAEMRRRAIIRPGETSSDHRIAAMQFKKELYERMTRRRRERKKDWHEFCCDAADDWDDYIFHGKTSSARTHYTDRKQKPRLRDGQHRILVGGTGNARPKPLARGRVAQIAML